MSTSIITLDGTTITLVPLPTWPAPRMVEPWVNDSVASITFPFSGQTQSQGSTGADLWGMNVTYPPLVEAQAAPFRAWLKQMRGISRAFQWTPADYAGPAGSPSGIPVAGNADANTVPDSNVADGFAYWSIPGSAWSLVAASPSPSPGCMAFQVSSAATGSFQYASSGSFQLIAGQTYTLSAFIDASHVTAGNPVWVLYDPAITVTYCSVSQSPGVASRISATFTFSPSGVTAGTAASVVLLFDLASCTIPSGSTLAGFAPMIQLGTVATTYVASISNITQSAASTTLYTSGWTPNIFGLLLPDDLIQIGYRLHSVLDIVSSDSNGQASFEIWPSLREDVAATTPIITGNPQGLFRLANNKRNWSKDYTQLTHLSFPISEYR
jgi:hypothetical protein